MNKELDHPLTNDGRGVAVETPLPSFVAETAPLLMIWLDPARLSRECLVSAVMASHPHTAIHPCETLEDCRALEGLGADLVVCYSHSEDRIDLGQIEAVHASFPAARIVVLSDAVSLTPGIVRDVLALGVAGFILTRRTGLQMMISALGLVHSGGTFVPRDFLFMESVGLAPAGSLALRKTGESRLTQREQAVLDLVRHGKPNKLIADELGMSASTVKVHVRNIMQKMGVSNRTQVALNAEQYLGSGS